MRYLSHLELKLLARRLLPAGFVGPNSSPALRSLRIPAVVVFMASMLVLLSFFLASIGPIEPSQIVLLSLLLALAAHTPIASGRTATRTLDSIQRRGYMLHPHAGRDLLKVRSLLGPGVLLLLGHGTLLLLGVVGQQFFSLRADMPTYAVALTASLVASEVWLPVSCLVGIKLAQWQERVAPSRRICAWLFLYFPVASIGWGLAGRSVALLLSQGVSTRANTPLIAAVLLASIAGASLSIALYRHFRDRIDAFDSDLSWVGLPASGGRRATHLWYGLSESVLRRGSSSELVEPLQRASLAAPYLGIFVASARSLVDDGRFRIVVLQYFIVGSVYFLHEIPRVLSAAIAGDISNLLILSPTAPRITRTRYMQHLFLLGPVAALIAVATAVIAWPTPGDTLVLVASGLLAAIALSAASSLALAHNLSGAIIEGAAITLVLMAAIPLLGAMASRPILGAAALAIVLVLILVVGAAVSVFSEWFFQIRLLPRRGSIE